MKEKTIIFSFFSEARFTIILHFLCVFLLVHENSHAIDLKTAKQDTFLLQPLNFSNNLAFFVYSSTSMQTLFIYQVQSIDLLFGKTRFFSFSSEAHGYNTS